MACGLKTGGALAWRQCVRQRCLFLTCLFLLSCKGKTRKRGLNEEKRVKRGKEVKRGKKGKMRKKG